MTSTAQRIGWAILIAVTLYVCYFSHLDVIGFVGPDEPRYAWIARDMAESGDWITPRLYGRPWFEKPPLLYWGGAVFFKLLGEGHPEFAARLPSAISALLATLALAWLAWRTYGEECARWLLLLLPTSVGMIGFSHACATDMPFAGMLTVAVVCAAVVLGLTPATQNTPILPAPGSGLVPTNPGITTSWLALILFGFFLGLAVLAKGPAGIILIGGAVFFWALFTKRWRDAFRLLHPAAIATFLVTALPWYIVCARRNPDFFRVFIIEHNFKRYLTPEFQHIQPFWFYVPILLIAFLPWIVILIWAVIVGARNREVHLSTAFPWSWFLFCLVFFSLSKSKLPGYILPAVPFAGILVARAIQALGSNHRKSFRIFIIIGAFAFAVLAAFSFTLRRTLDHQSPVNGRTAVALGWLCFLFFLSQVLALASAVPALRNLQLHSAAGIPMVLAVLFAPTFAVAPFQFDPSGKTLASELISRGVARSDLFLGHMERGKQLSLNFYLRSEIPDWEPERPRTGFLLLREKYCGSQVRLPYVCSDSADYLQRSGTFLYQVTLRDSLSGTDSSSRRQPQQEK